MNYTIGQLAKEFGLSRSTLLYYDRRGLLRPSVRSAANYRGYSDADHRRLRKIITYRNTGLSLAEIQELLSGECDNRRTRVLESQLDRLNKDIAQLRTQQQTIIDMLGSDTIAKSTRAINKEQWVGLLASIGMSESEMHEWHVEFEGRMPEAHQDFLESLNIPKDEIKLIRKRSRQR
ncbi:MAG: MerR family transcriptional regulator [Pseudomonadales bacterium]